MLDTMTVRLAFAYDEPMTAYQVASKIGVPDVAMVQEVLDYLVDTYHLNYFEQHGETYYVKESVRFEGGQF